MIETLKQLIRLQEVDTAILTVLRRKEEGPRRLQEIEVHLDSLYQEVQNSRAQAEEQMEKRRAAEMDVEETRAKIGKSQTRLSQVKNNREYRAILKEVEDLKRAMKFKEDEALQFEEEYDRLGKLIKDQEAVWNGEKAKIEHERKELEELCRKADDELSEYESLKSELSKGIDQEMFRRYDFLQKNKGGIAVAGVRKGICMVCHMNLPPQHFNELMRNDHLLTCPSCQRIIYWMDHDEFRSKDEESDAA